MVETLTLTQRQGVAHLQRYRERYRDGDLTMQALQVGELATRASVSVRVYRQGAPCAPIKGSKDQGDAPVSTTVDRASGVTPIADVTTPALPSRTCSEAAIGP